MLTLIRRNSLKRAEVLKIKNQNKARIEAGNHFAKHHMTDYRGYCDECKAIVGTHEGKKYK